MFVFISVLAALFLTCFFQPKKGEQVSKEKKAASAAAGGGRAKKKVCKLIVFIPCF